MRKLLPAAISRPAIAPRAIKKSRSMAAANAGPISAGETTAARPATQIANNAASGAPATGARPVQLGTAVKRKPAIVAGR